MTNEPTINPSDLAEIARFLQSVGQADLFEYLVVPVDAPDDDVEAAIRKRRAWAQGQQSNPKFKQEALWVIKNVGRIQRATIEARLDYMRHVRSAATRRQMEILDLFILGSLASGPLTDRSEAAIFEQGHRQGLDDTIIRERIEFLCREHGHTPDAAAAPVQTADPYALLGVSRTADLATIERAYKERYHAARQHPNPVEAERDYKALDSALAVLRDPEQRAAHDATLGQPASATADAPKMRLKDEPTAETTSSALRLVQRPASNAPPKRSARLRFVQGGPLDIRVVESQSTDVIEVGFDGDQPQPVTAFADRPWINVSPPMIELAPGSQASLRVTVTADAMTRRQETGTITVKTNEAAPITMEIRAVRRRRLPQRWRLWAALAGGLLTGGLVLTTALVLTEAPPPVRTALTIQVDPPAGEIYIDQALISTSGSAEVPDVTPDVPIVVSVQQDGFAPWTETVTPAAGEVTHLNARLTLTDSVSWVPNEESERTDVNAREISDAFRSRKREIISCYIEHLDPAPNRLLLADLDLYINSSGRIVGVTFNNENYPRSDRLHHCMKRQIRSMKLTFVAGDYAVGHHHVRIRVPSTEESP